MDYKKIDQIIINNNELKSLQSLVKLSLKTKKISKRYPSLDLQINGLPKYVVGKNYNSNTQTTKHHNFPLTPLLT